MNDTLGTAPETINEDPHGQDWDTITLALSGPSIDCTDAES